jgi:hypothetical protein
MADGKKTFWAGFWGGVVGAAVLGAGGVGLHALLQKSYGHFCHSFVAPMSLMKDATDTGLSVRIGGHLRYSKMNHRAHLCLMPFAAHLPQDATAGIVKAENSPIPVFALPTKAVQKLVKCWGPDGKSVIDGTFSVSVNIDGSIAFQMAGLANQAWGLAERVEIELPIEL